MRVRDLLIDQRFDVLVVDLLLLVGQRLEAHEGIFELVAGELIAQLFQLVHESVAAGVLAHDQRGLFHADVFRRHDLVGLRILEHAVLMDAALMRERIPSDDRLVVLHRERRCRRHQLRGARQHRGVDLGVERQHVVAHLHRHHDFFKRGIARPFADAVDGALDLARAGQMPASEFATAMPRSLWQCAENRALSEFGTRSRSMRDKREIFVRRGVADGVGDVDRGRAGPDRSFDTRGTGNRARCGCRPPPTIRHRRCDCARGVTCAITIS